MLLLGLLYEKYLDWKWKNTKKKELEKEIEEREKRARANEKKYLNWW